MPRGPGNVTVGVGAGPALPDIDPGCDDVDADSDPGAAFGAGIGYAFSDAWSAELEFVTGSAKTTFSGPGGTVSADIDVGTFAAYAAWRSSGQIYFSGRLGVRRSDVSSDVEGAPDDSDTGASFGAGLGYRLAERLSVEATYTLIGSDVSWLLLSGRYAFDL